MERAESLSSEIFLQEDSFGFIKPEEYEFLGIDPADIPPGTYSAHKHPSTLLSRFGGNAYGFGFFEVYGRLNQKDLTLLQSVNPEKPEQTRKYYKEINRIYKNIGLLIRFSSQGSPYYLIPIHLALSSLSTIKNKTAEISKIVHFHRKKYMKESHKIGLLTSADDLIINELSLRFKEHEFVLLDSFEKLRFPQYTLDMVILPRDIYEIVFMEKLAPPSGGRAPKRQVENYAIYLLEKIYSLLKPEGEIFIIANRLARKTNRWIDVTFKSEHEEKNFALFSHIFKTKKKYRTEDRSVEVYSFDFQKYLNPPYLEKEVLDSVLEGRHLEDMAMEKIHDLPYLNLPLEDEPGYDQEEAWPKMLSRYFNKIFLKPLIPESIREEWDKRFSIDSYVPEYMFIYLGQKKALQTTLEELKKDLIESRLSGCPLPLLADYRDSFDYLVTTLNVLKRIKGGSYAGLPELFMERLKEPLENKKRRYGDLNDVLRLMTKTSRLERINRYLNPDGIEGARTQVLKNLEILSLFGFTYGELREIFLIVVGHTPMGRILSGKMNEKTLKPVSDLARTHDPQEALNLLRYCRLMSMAETVASKKTDLNQEELTELFDLYEFTVKVVSNREMDWDRLLDENISAMGGVHNKVVRNILKMMNHFQFLAGWFELSQKGEMEKEALADYDDEKLGKIERVIKLVEIINQFEEVYFGNDPFQAAIFYRKFLKMEFHGTGHIFQRLDSELVWLFLWITVNVTRGDIINFNPLLAEAGPSESDEYVRKLEEEAHAINTKYLDLTTLRHFSEQLYEDQTSFIMGTGFQLRVNRETQAVDMSYIDMNENIAKLETLMKDFRGVKISEIPVEKLRELEGLFANLEGFYQSHVRFLSHEEEDLRLPERQREWFKRAQDLKASLRSQFVRVIFQPEDVHTDLALLYRHS
ncbi:MAG: hypothetical protein MUO52_03180, partial [Desulfobacterales bacterium]|nr:hypothetical protein [Desulfobacterales bacterium]